MLSDELLEEILSHFGTQNRVCLATLEGDQPRVRIMSLIRMNNWFYFITGAWGGADTAKFIQITANPKIEFVMQVERDGDVGNIRTAGLAFLEDDPMIRERLFREIGWVKNYFKGFEDPTYVVLRVEVASYQYRPPGRREIVSIEV
jgi:uncharacterized pyridoxamine 5'-phosphate oxidase family protein